MQVDRKAWTIGSYEFSLIKTGSESFTIEAQDTTKQRWKSMEYDEDGASKATCGIYDQAAKVLFQILEAGFSNSQNKSTIKESFEEIEIKEEAKNLKLEVTVKERYNKRRFEILLEKQNDDPVWRLEQIIKDKDAEIKMLRDQVHEVGQQLELVRIQANNSVPKEQHRADMQNVNTKSLALSQQLEDVRNKMPGLALAGYHASVSPNTDTDVAHIRLPAGSYAVHYSFFCTVSAGNWIYFDLMYGNSRVLNQGNNGGHYVYESSNPNSGYPRPISGVAVVNASGNDSVYLRFKPYSSQPSFSNIVIVAHKIC